MPATAGKQQQLGFQQQQLRFQQQHATSSSRDANNSRDTGTISYAANGTDNLTQERTMIATAITQATEGMPEIAGPTTTAGSLMTRTPTTSGALATAGIPAIAGAPARARMPATEKTIAAIAKDY